MKRMFAIVAAFGLASCDVYRPPPATGGAAELPAGASGAGSPDRIGVITNKSVPDYYRDLEHCRAVVAGSMGPPGTTDDLEALKRALKEHPHDKVVSLSYVNDDLKMKRTESIKGCLSRLGYLVQ